MIFDLSERLYLHVFSKNKRRDAAAKIWLNPIEIFDKGGLTQKELNTSLKIIENNSDEIAAAINSFKEGNKIKTIKL